MGESVGGYVGICGAHASHVFVCVLQVAVMAMYNC